jgi:hypothetical protein
MVKNRGRAVEEAPKQHSEAREDVSINLCGGIRRIYPDEPITLW